MKKASFLPGIWMVLSAVVCLSFSQVSGAAEYTIDTAHSNVEFTVRHLASKLKGDFKEYSGKLNFDSVKPEETKVEAEVKIASISTNDKKRDEHLKSDDFFAAKKFPTMKFVSTEVKKAEGDKKYKMTGNLTMHGVTKPVTFDVEFLGEARDPWGVSRAGFSGTASINRKDYGINWNKALDNGGVLVGDDVAINLNVEATPVKKEEAKKQANKKEATE